LNPLKFISTFFKSTASVAGQVGIAVGLDKQHSTDKSNDLGVFNSCDTLGFGIDLKDGHYFIKWIDIERVVVYKADLLTTDVVCMDITFNGKTIIVTEEAKGWDTFTNQLKSTLRLNNDNWETLILQPPFAYNLMIIYERIDELKLVYFCRDLIVTNSNQSVNAK
jgi:hypothetical protein